MELFTGTANEEVTRRAAALRSLVPLPMRSPAFWVDTGYMNRTTRPGLANPRPLHDGRFVLGGLSQTDNNLSANANVQLLGLVNEFSKNQYGKPHILDAYLEIGHSPGTSSFAASWPGRSTAAARG